MNSIPSHSTLDFVHTVITALSLRLGGDNISSHQQVPPLCGLFWLLFLLNFALERYLFITFCYSNNIGLLDRQLSITSSFTGDFLLCRYNEIHLLYNVWHWPCTRSWLMWCLWNLCWAPFPVQLEIYKMDPIRHPECILNTLVCKCVTGTEAVRRVYELNKDGYFFAKSFLLLIQMDV